MGAIGTSPAALAAGLSGETRPQPGAKAQRFYRPELDVLRFAAFMSVFFCHGLPFDDAKHAHAGRAWQWMQHVREAGNFGVCLFFLLSSYLITELLRREYLQTQSVHLKAFYLRRSLRIWPLYFAVLLAVGITGVFIKSEHMGWVQTLAYVFFVGNWFSLFNPAIPNPLSWLWSISVEEQFYVVWPTMAKLGGTRIITAGSILCLPLSVVAIAFVERYQQQPEVTVWLNSIVQFQFFAWGALLAIFLAGKVPELSPVLRMALAGLGSASWLAASGLCLLKRPGVDPGVFKLSVGYELVAAGCVCFFLAALGAPVSKIPSVIVYLGKISYGLYVFHEIALTATTAIRQHFEQSTTLHGASTSLLFLADRVCALGLTIAIAALSYRFIETPFLQLKSRFTFVRSRPV